MTRLEARLIGEIARLSRAWSLIEPDDHILVAISGGKDSWAMLHLLERLRGRVPFTFTMTAVPRGAQIARTARACATSSRADMSFSRTWIASAPPSIAHATTSSHGLAQCARVTSTQSRHCRGRASDARTITRASSAYAR